MTTSSIPFTAGEGLVSADLNLVQDLIARALNDGVLAHLALDRFDAVNYGSYHQDPTLQWFPGGTVLRPFGHAGMVWRHSNSQIRVAGGLWFAHTYGDGWNSNEPTSVVGIKQGTQDFTLVATGAGQFRRDIVQARVLPTVEAAVSRLTKDAVTGVVSTTSLVKRINNVVEYAVKQGAQAASIALALEPAADAGWVKIGSALVRDNILANATSDQEIYDWRLPVGDAVVPQLPISMGPTNVAGWTVGSDGVGEYRLSVAAAGHELFATFVDATSFVGTDDMKICARRITRVTVAADYGAVAPSATQVRFRRKKFASLFGTDIGGTPGPAIWNGEVGTRISGGPVRQQVYGPSFPGDPPLWSNGMFNPRNDDANHGQIMTNLALKFIGANADDKIYGVFWEVAGK